MRTLMLVSLFLLHGACKKHDVEPESNDPVLDPISLENLPSAVSKERLAATNSAIKAIDVSLELLRGSDCDKATAAVNTIVASMSTLRVESNEMALHVASLDDSAARDWWTRYYTPVVIGRSTEYGKQVAMAVSSSKCMSNEVFKAAAQRIKPAMGSGSGSAVP